MNAEMVNELEAYILPANPQNVLLPASAIVEVVSVATMIPVSKKPNWFLGKLGWQGRTLPMVAFSRMNSPDVQLGQFRFAAIIRGSKDVTELPLYALALSSSAKQLTLKRAQVQALQDSTGMAAAAVVSLGRDPLYIPNMDYVESQIIEHQT